MWYCNWWALPLFHIVELRLDLMDARSLVRCSCVFNRRGASPLLVSDLDVLVSSSSHRFPSAIQIALRKRTWFGFVVHSMRLEARTSATSRAMYISCMMTPMAMGESRAIYHLDDWWWFASFANCEPANNGPMLKSMINISIRCCLMLCYTSATHGNVWVLENWRAAWASLISFPLPVPVFARTQLEQEVEIVHDGCARKFHCDDDDAMMANDTKFTFSILFARACVPVAFLDKKIILSRFQTFMIFVRFLMHVKWDGRSTIPTKVHGKKWKVTFGHSLRCSQRYTYHRTKEKRVSASLRVPFCMATRRTESSAPRIQLHSRFGLQVRIHSIVRAFHQNKLYHFVRCSLPFFNFIKLKV